jgi:hypothetical protein
VKRRDALKLFGGAPIAFGMSATVATSQQSTEGYPLSDKVREEFERLLGAQEREAQILGFRETPRIPETPLDRYLMWSLIAHDTSAQDHTPTRTDIPEPPQRFGAQLGPHRSSRAMAIVHVAMFEAINAVSKKRASFINLASPTVDLSAQTAAAWAAHDALIALYPFQQQRISGLLASDLTRIPEINDFSSDAATDKSNKLANASRDLGKAAAAGILAARANDNSAHKEPEIGVDHTVVDMPGHWRMDPVSKLSIAMGAKWGAVKPFTLTTGDMFRPAPPPSLEDPSYVASLAQVRKVGAKNSTERHDFETFEGNFWAYDGTANLCAPPRLYNKIVQDVALQKGIRDLDEMARLLAVANIAMADAAIAAWDAKWHYDFWRPVSAIQLAAADADPNWEPLGAPATNGRGPNFTPPFPAYPSGHAVFGGAVFETLRALVPAGGKEHFVFVSDEYNGENRGIGDVMPRPRLPQSFVSYSHPEFLNARSRIFLGIHFDFDASVGIEMGQKVGMHVLANVYV